MYILAGIELGTHSRGLSQHISNFVLHPNIWFETTGNMWSKATRMFWCYKIYKFVPPTLK